MNDSTSKGCLLIQNSYETSGCKSAKDKELVCRSDRTFLTSHHESAQDLESGLCLIYCPYKTKQKSSLYLVLLPYSSLASCLSGHLEGFKSIPPYIWMTEVIVCTVRVELHWLHHIEFFSFFPFFSPPGRLSPIISTLHVCKAWAPWGILCPLHPLLCWGLCSSWHLAPPVQPLCRCLYSQLPCPCPWPLLQPVCQPALYSRYNLRPIRPRRKKSKIQSRSLCSVDLPLCSLLIVFKFKASTSYVANPALPSGFVALLLCTQEHIQRGTVCPSLTATSLSPLSPGFSPALNPCSSLRLTKGLQVLPASWQLGPKGLRVGGGGGQRQRQRH